MADTNPNDPIVKPHAPATPPQGDPIVKPGMTAAGAVPVDDPIVKPKDPIVKP